MKSLARNIAIYSLSLYLLTFILDGVRVSGGWVSYIIGGIILYLMFLSTVICTLIFWLIVAALPVVISNEGLPHALRSILMAPPVLILAALGGIYFYDWLAKKLSKKMLLVFCSLLFAILITEAYSSYFYSWGRNNEVKNAFSQNYVEIGRMLNGLPRELPKYVVVQEGGVPVRGLPMPTQTVMFITDTFLPKEQSQKNIFYILPSQKEGLPPNAITINLN